MSSLEIESVFGYSFGGENNASQLQATFEAIWQRMCQGEAPRSTAPITLPYSCFPSFSSPFPAPYETVQGEKDDYVAPSVLFVSTRKPINPSKPISPRGEKISLAHIMTNSCRLFGLRHDDGEEGGGREQEGDGENVGVGKDEKVMASQCYPR